MSRNYCKIIVDGVGVTPLVSFRSFFRARRMSPHMEELRCRPCIDAFRICACPLNGRPGERHRLAVL